MAACGIICGAALLHIPARSSNGHVSSVRPTAEADELPGREHLIPRAPQDHSDDENFRTIDRPGADFTLLWGIDSQGDIVGTAGKGIAFHGGSGFVRRADGRFLTIDAAVPGAAVTMTSARAMNAAGEIVGFYKDTSNFNHGFIRKLDGRFKVIDYPGAVFRPFEDESGALAETGALAIDPRGAIVGNYLGVAGDTIKTHGFMLRHGKYTSIDYPGAVQTFARGINPAGDIVGRYDILNASTNQVETHSFLLHHGKFTSIDFPGAVRTFARGINSAGDIVGRYDILDATTKKPKVLGFLLRQGDFISIEYPANGINAPGQIVGSYTSADGKVHGYLMSGATTGKTAPQPLTPY
jgi:uncharacterized membrane protein